jgi:ribose 5-phosphate isomerase RpiB
MDTIAIGSDHAGLSLKEELVNPSDGGLQWFVDEAAAGNLRKR